MAKMVTYAYLEDVMDWVFTNPRTRKRRLKALLRGEPIKSVEKGLGMSLHPQAKFHFAALIKTVNVSKKKRYLLHRNAMIHSGNTLKFILDVMEKRSTPPPPWVC